MCSCRVKRRADLSESDRSGVKESKACQAGERLSIHCSSLSYAFVHQKGDYSADPALCHSRVRVSKSTNINAPMYEQAAYVPVRPSLFVTTECDLCRLTVLTPGKKNHNLWHKCHNCFDCGCWCLISPSVLCTMCLQWPAAGASHGLQ